jgi:hypothetical protein
MNTRLRTHTHIAIARTMPFTLINTVPKSKGRPLLDGLCVRNCGYILHIE